MSINTEYEHPSILLPKLIKEQYHLKYSNLLDVGCGGGTVGGTSWDCEIHCIDIFPPVITPKNFILGDARDLKKYYIPKSFDIVMCCEMIEHLPKEE